MKTIVMPEPQKVALTDLVFAPYNPRVITNAEMAALKASMLKHGMVLNLVVQREADDGTPLVLIGGHQRVRAARELCSQEGWQLPTDAWATVLTIKDREAKLLNVGLNKIGGEFDVYKLGHLFDEMKFSVDEIGMSGFDLGGVDDILALVRDEEYGGINPDGLIGEMGDFARSVTLSIEFDTTEHRDAVKARLLKVAKDEEIKPGEIVYTALLGELPPIRLAEPEAGDDQVESGEIAEKPTKKKAAKKKAAKKKAAKKVA